MSNYFTFMIIPFLGWNITISRDDSREFLSGDDIQPYNVDPLMLSVFYACLRVRAESISSLLLKEYREIDGKVIETNETGILSFFKKKANKYTTGHAFIESLACNYMLGGNGCAVINRSKFGTIQSLMQVQYTDIEIKIEEKEIYYLINDKRYEYEDIFNVPYFSLNGITGLSVLQTAANTIRLADSFNVYQDKFLKNGSFPTAIYEIDEVLSAEAMKKVKQSIKNQSGASNSGEPIVLDSGVKRTNVSISPVDAEILNSKKYNALDICRFFRVPPHMVNELDGAKYANVEQQALDFAQSLVPDCNRIESAINTQLLSDDMVKKGYFFNFDMDSLYRADMKTRYGVYAIGKTNGILSSNECRAKENLSPVPGGDKYYMAVNLQPIDNPVNQQQITDKTQEDNNNGEKNSEN